MNKRLFPFLYGAVLTAFTVFIALDTFVLSAAYQTDATAMDTSMLTQIASTAVPETAEAAEATEAAETESASGKRPSSGRSKHGASGESEAPETAETVTPAEKAAAAVDLSTAAVTENTYQDENISVTLTEFEQYGTTVYVADIRLTSVEYLKTAFADNTYGKNVKAKTSEMAAEHDAILAVNGDYYGAQEKGYVIRNGVVYRETAGSDDVLCIYADGTMAVVDPGAATAQELAASGVWQAFSFGPGLVENGQITVSEDDEVGKAKASNPRTAIGMIEPGHYVFVVSDGRTDESEGLSLYQLAQILQSLGVQVGYNLDGGGSSTMVFMGELVNNPTTGGKIKERSVSDIVYIG